MPVVSIHRGTVGPTIRYDIGTQTIAAGGSFQLNGETVFELDPALFTQTGTYILVNYSAGGPSGTGFTWTGGYANGQAALNALASVDDSDLIGLTAGSLTDDTVNRWITVTLT